MGNHRTLIKYVGNKQSYMRHIACHFDWSDIKRYVEPFCGALGSVINANVPDNVELILSDSNWEMMNLHEQCAMNSTKLESFVNSFRIDESTYYSIRAWDRVGNMRNIYSPLEIAARTVYLNRHCFNGLYRINRKGEFNVAWNKDMSIMTVNMGDFTKTLDVCTHAKLSCIDYIAALRSCGEGDLIYCDPPYANVKKINAKFNGYVGGFDFFEQIRLHDELVMAKNRGARVYATNAAIDEIRKLYHEFNIIDIQNIRRTLSPNGQNRKPVTELLMRL